MIRAIDRFVERLALLTALLGGAALIAAMAITVISVMGRQLIVAGLGPIPGDYELVEAGAAFAIFAFLPWCHVRREHVTVDLFLAKAGPRANAAIDLVANLLLTAVAIILFRQMMLGMIDKRTYGDTSYILQYELWLTYAVALWGAGVFVLVAAWSVLRSAREIRDGAPVASTLAEVAATTVPGAPR